MSTAQVQQIVREVRAGFREDIAALLPAPGTWSSEQLDRAERLSEENTRNIAELTKKTDANAADIKALTTDINELSKTVAIQQVEIKHVSDDVKSLAATMREQGHRLDKLSLDIHGYVSSARTLSWVVGAIGVIATVIALFK